MELKGLMKPWAEDLTWYSLRVGDVLLSRDTAYLIVRSDEREFRALNLNTGETCGIRNDTMRIAPEIWEVVRGSR